MQRVQGPKPGPLAGRKRKPEEELSTQAKKERERLQRMSDVKRQVHNAKNADKQAVWRAINKVKNKETSKDASAEERARLVAATRAKVMRKRKTEGRAAECVAERLGYRDDSSDDSSDDEEDEGNRAGNDVEETDPVIKEEENGTGDDVEETAPVVDEHGNRAGTEVEEIEETDPVIEEQHLQRDHIETLSSAAIFEKPGEEHTRRYSKLKPQAKQLKNDLIWQYWATFWKDASRDFTCKVDRLAKMSSEELLAQQPHTYFSETDRACFRSLQFWPKVCGGPWAELLGPESWWGDDYDFARYGWEAEVNDPRAMSARCEALDMVFAAEMPMTFPEYLFNFTELKVLRALPDDFHH